MGFSWLDPGDSGSDVSSAGTTGPAETGMAPRAAPGRTPCVEDGRLAAWGNLPDRGSAVAFAARREQDDPQLPCWRDDARTWLHWYSRHVPTAEEFARLVERMASEGLLTSAEVVTFAGRPTADSVAELVAKVRAVDDIARARDAGEPT